jgi:hypothetical protein
MGGLGITTTAKTSPNSLLKKASINSVHESTVLEAAVFPQELALAKPVAHEEFALDQFFNGLLTICVTRSQFLRPGPK